MAGGCEDSGHAARVFCARESRKGCSSCGDGMQGVKCRQGKCKGFLLEQRADELSDGCHWACTGCSCSVPSLPASGTTPSPAQLVYPEALMASLRCSWEEAMGLMQTKVGSSVDRVLFVYRHICQDFSKPVW